MFSKKYSIRLERESFVYNMEGEISKFKFPISSQFQTKYINKGKAIIKSPFCNNIRECHDKFEERINVISMELHQFNLLLCPFNKGIGENENKNNKIKVLFSIDKDFLKALERKEGKDYYSKFQENLNNGKWFLCQIIYGLSFRYDRNLNTFFEFEKDIEIDELVDIKVKKESVEFVFSYPCIFDKCGIKMYDLAFLVSFVFGCMIFEKGHYNKGYQKLKNSFSQSYIKNIKEEFKRIIILDERYNFGCKEELKELIEIFDKKMNKSSANIYQDREFILNLAKKYYEDSFSSRYVIKRFPKLDGSAVALIKDALSQEIDFNVVDEAKSFIEFSYKSHKEEVIMATMTSKDSYILPYITDDKQFAKDILYKNRLSVPDSILVNSNMNSFELNYAVNSVVGKAVVIKPKSTNSGTGISIFSSPASEKEIAGAVKYAFKFDDNVLIENYIKGREYRFLIVDDKCVGVAHRRSASIVGDGKSTIRELIDLKNKEPWHALLDNPVVIDKVAEDFLNKNGYTFESVPEASKRVFLRENSNCSTGGECIDVTDGMPVYFKKKAILAAKCFKAKIAGVDIIIDDLKSKDYAIIEINDNPGYSLNEWPYEGKGEKIGLYILKMLGF